jgi:hypothetical protein
VEGSSRAKVEAIGMFVSLRSTGVILTECPDRRAHPRLEHAEAVELNGQPVEGRDISARGLSILIPPAVKLGDIVRVRLAGCLDSGEAVMANARVARLDGTAEGLVVGLEFVE